VRARKGASSPLAAAGNGRRPRSIEPAATGKVSEAHALERPAGDEAWVDLPYARTVTPMTRSKKLYNINGLVWQGLGPLDAFRFWRA
jgi:hypothetical protein